MEKKCDFTNRLTAHRRALHRRAEIGFELPKTREYILRELEKLGYSPSVIGKGSILAKSDQDCDGYVLLRADMDALSIVEETGLHFSSTSGTMHACGHDMHAAMLLGAAELLKRVDLSARVGVLLLFQAGEECLQGAADVIESGLFERYRVFCSFSVHVLCGIPFKSGTIVLPPHGTAAPGADVLRLTVYGKAAHGSTPHIGRSSLYPAMDIINAINLMLLQEIAPSKMRVLNWGRIVGGEAENVVAEVTEISGNFRYYDEDMRSFVHGRIKEISEHIAQAYGCRARLEVLGGCPPLKNDESLLRAISKDIYGCFDGVVDGNAMEKNSVRESLGGSEDFAHFAKRVPSVLLSICAGRTEDGYDEPLHSSKTDFDESALPTGARLLAKLPFIVEKSLRL